MSRSTELTAKHEWGHLLQLKTLTYASTHGDHIKCVTQDHSSCCSHHIQLVIPFTCSNTSPSFHDTNMNFLFLPIGNCLSSCCKVITWLWLLIQNVTFLDSICKRVIFLDRSGCSLVIFGAEGITHVKS